MLTSEKVVEYLIVIDLQRKGAENKLNAEGLSALLDLQSDKELKDVKMVDILDYIHAQEEEIEELKASVDYWQNEVFKKMEVKLAGVTKEKIQEIRHQVCDEIRTYDRTTNKQKVSYTEYVIGLCEFLDQIEKGEE